MGIRILLYYREGIVGDCVIRGNIGFFNSFLVLSSFIFLVIGSSRIVGFIL